VFDIPGQETALMETFATLLAFTLFLIALKTKNALTKRTVE
jgi:hypothetical protein